MYIDLCIKTVINLISASISFLSKKISRRVDLEILFVKLPTNEFHRCLILYSNEQREP